MPREAVYGAPPAALAPVATDAVQVSPLVVGATTIEELPPGSLARMTVLAPPGTLERRYVLAQALTALEPGGALVALAPKVRGGARLADELRAFGCEPMETGRRHHRICHCARPTAPSGLEAAIAAGGRQSVTALGLISQPGIFSWDRLDPGSALLLAQPWTPAGAGADLGCGYGVLSRQMLASPEVTQVTLIDIDRRAIDAARANIDDPRGCFLQHDLRAAPIALAKLDFAIMNPPFHDGGVEDRKLGQAFVATARAMLKDGGVLRMVANVALSYEPVLAARFKQVSLVGRQGGYKVLEARA
ncbi:MAG TPA: class I SAM-dependent methyltransferase [Caulobacteraceae bacterium]